MTKSLVLSVLALLAVSTSVLAQTRPADIEATTVDGSAPVIKPAPPVITPPPAVTPTPSPDVAKAPPVVAPPDRVIVLDKPSAEAVRIEKLEAEMKAARKASDEKMDELKKLILESKKSEPATEPKAPTPIREASLPPASTEREPVARPSQPHKDVMGDQDPLTAKKGWKPRYGEIQPNQTGFMDITSTPCSSSNPETGAVRNGVRARNKDGQWGCKLNPL